MNRLLSIFTSEGLSSKRITGFFGLILIHACWAYRFVTFGESGAWSSLQGLTLPCWDSRQ